MCLSQHVPTAGEGWALIGHVGHSLIVSCAECGHMVGGVQGDEENPIRSGECSAVVLHVMLW